VLISHNVNIMDTDAHELDRDVRARSSVGTLLGGLPKERGQIQSSPITIEDHVWIGFNCGILKGVTIGEGSIIGAGAVVTKDVPPYSLVVGPSGKVIRQLPRPGAEPGKNA
jgi:acetyltransferase-like isoleucine patch superfamily enzyme